MAGRKRGYRHPEEVREKIQATQLINRLQAHVDAREPILDASQVNAAKALLNKVLPDLKAVELTGQNGEPIEVKDVTNRATAFKSRLVGAASRSGTPEAD